jgi:phenylalanyl-tRNA synthetase alpha subunit
MNEPSSYSTRQCSFPHTESSGTIDGPCDEQVDAGITTDPAGRLLEIVGVGVLESETVT